MCTKLIVQDTAHFLSDTLVMAANADPTVSFKKYYRYMSSQQKKEGGLPFETQLTIKLSSAQLKKKLKVNSYNI